MLSELLYDTNFWVLISFLIFVGIFIKYGKSKVLGNLDERISSIKTELETAERLRIEAQEVLADYQRKQKDAIKEAELIIADAKAQAENMRQNAENEWQKTMSRREEQLNERLSRIEDNARHDIEAYTAQLAINATRKVLKDKMDNKSDKPLLDNTLEQLSRALN